MSDKSRRLEDVEEMIEAAIDREAPGTSEEATVWRHGRLAGTQTILLVEDEKFVREVTGEVLRSAGYRVLSARDAVEARRACEMYVGEVDLLLTDVVLPGETGRALAARLRWQTPEIRILLISGYSHQIGAQAESCEECLAKPFSAAGLLGKVQQVLQGRGSLPVNQA